MSMSTYSKVTGLAAVVAAATGGATVQTKRGAVSLDVANALAVVALLGWDRRQQGCSEASRDEKVPYSRWYEEEGSCWTRVLFEME